MSDETQDHQEQPEETQPETVSAQEHEKAQTQIQELQAQSQEYQTWFQAHMPDQETFESFQKFHAGGGKAQPEAAPQEAEDYDIFDDVNESDGKSKCHQRRTKVHQPRETRSQRTARQIPLPCRPNSNQHALFSLCIPRWAQEYGSVCKRDWEFHKLPGWWWPTSPSAHQRTGNGGVSSAASGA